MLVAVVCRVLPSSSRNVVQRGLLNARLQDDADNQAVNTQDTSHNNGDQGLEDELRLEHTHGGNTNASFGSAVSGTQVAENEGGSDAHKPEEGVLVGVIDCKVMNQHLR